MSTVLLVEDSQDIRELMLEFLEGEGFDVLEACNGKEALEVLESAPVAIDLVLLDHAMPIMDGMTFLRLLERDTRHPKLPVIMISANPRPKQSARCSAFLQKPPDLDELLKLARQLCCAPAQES